MTNLSDLFPAGAGKQVSFTASGAISAAGKPVILNSAGTVTQVAASPTTQTIPATGSNKVLYWGGGSSTGATYYSYMSTHPTDTTKSVVLSTSSSAGYARVLVRDDVTLTLGTAVQYEASNTVSYQQVACGKVSGQFLIHYKDGSGGYPTVIVGTISDSDCSFGTPVVAISSDYYYLSCAADILTDNKYIIGYKNNSSQIAASVVTVSNTVPSVGSATSFTNPPNPEHTDCFFNPNVAGAFAFVSLTGVGDKPAVLQCTYSGTSVSGTATYTAVTDDSGKDARGAYDATTGNIVIAYRDKGSPYYGAVRVIEANGTLNTKVNVSSSALSAVGVRCIDVAADPDVTTQFSTIFNESGNVFARGFYTSGSTGSMTCTLNTKVAVVAGAQNYQDVSIDYCYDASKFQSLWTDGANEVNNGTVQVSQGVGSQVTNLTATNFIGIADAAISSAASGNVTIKGGIATNLGGATYVVTVANPGSGNRYYIDGVLQQKVDMLEGFTYKFDQSAASNSGHPLRLSTTSNGTHAGGSEYTTGVTTVGTPGSAGAYTQIVVAVAAPTLYYYCSVHSLMGSTAFTLTGFVANSDYYVQADGSITTSSAGVKIGRAMSSTALNLEYTS